MVNTALFEESVDTQRGHGRVTITVELGGENPIRITIEGRDAPTVVCEYTDPAEVLAIGKALVRAAETAIAAAGVEAG